jgi:hypothetical protein
MPRGIPNAKSGTKTSTKPATKAVAVKPAASKPVPEAPSANHSAMAGLVVSTIEKGNAVMKPVVAAVSPVVAEAVVKIEVAIKDSGFRHSFGDSAYLSVVGNKKGLRQTALLILNGEVLASTQDFLVPDEYYAAFLIDGKQHRLPFRVETEVFDDISSYSGVLLSPVDREEVSKILKNINDKALALAEDTMSLLLQQERPTFTRGDVVVHMIDKDKRFLVVDVAKPADPRTGGYRPQLFSGRDASEVELDLIIMAIDVTYHHERDVAEPRVTTEPKKVYSGLYLLAE